jgi:hypothetical protein
MGPAIPDAALAEDVPTHELVGAPASEAEPPPGVGERLDEVAARYYGNPAYWRLLAALNGLADPLRVPAGTLLRLPPLSALLGGAGGSQ